MTCDAILARRRCHHERPTRPRTARSAKTPASGAGGRSPFGLDRVAKLLWITCEEDLDQTPTFVYGADAEPGGSRFEGKPSSFDPERVGLVSRGSRSPS